MQDAVFGKKRRAFIAAPLIGTLLFLSAILFTVNLNKIEAAQSARIVNDAYHNRIVSLIEIYRTDLNSVFRESVRRNIQEYILDPGWNNLDLRNQDDAGNYLTYSQVRKQRCEGIKRLSQQVVCSIASDTSNNSRNTAHFGYGIPGWVEVASREFSFEGIRFKPANLQQMSLLNPPRNLADHVAQDQAYRSYTESCRNLVQENLFDCDHFATGTPSADQRYGPLQCKDTDGRSLPGCVEGTFYMRVDPRGVNAAHSSGDAALYAALPRIEGDDGFGNQVRSGAIGDDVFYLPINLRVFFYDDLALTFYDKLGYNSGSGPKGLIGGICSGSPEACREVHIRSNLAGGHLPPLSNDLTNVQIKRAKENVMKYFINNAYQSGVTALTNKRRSLPSSEVGQLEFRMMFSQVFELNKCLDESTTPRRASDACKDVIVQGRPALNVVDKIPGLDPQPNFYDVPPSGPGRGAYYDKVDLHFFVLDYKPEFKVVGTEPNHPSYGMTFVAQP